MEISDFLRKQVPLPMLPDDYKENAEWEEKRSFQAWIKKYPAEEHSGIEEHIRYIRKYALRYPDFDGEEYSPSWYAFTYYDFREERIKQCGLSESEFFQFDILQNVKTKYNSPIACCTKVVIASIPSLAALIV